MHEPLVFSTTKYQYLADAIAKLGSWEPGARRSRARAHRIDALRVVARHRDGLALASCRSAAIEVP